MSQRVDQPRAPERALAEELAGRLGRLPDNHASSPRYAGQHPGEAGRPGRDAADGDSAGGDLPRLEDREYAAHVRTVETRLREAEKGGLSTDVLYTSDPGRKVWAKDRVDAQRQIIDELLTSAADVPCAGKAIIAGGLGGAGKSTILARFAGIDRARYLTINPDDIKEKMAERGLIPEVEGLSPMECTPLAHEESSLIAGRLASKALADRKNVIWDITMSSRGSVDRRITDLRDAGYRQVEGVFVDIPVETSVQRALARHRGGLERYRHGEGPGGRYVPPGLIRQQEAPGGGTVNRQVFDGLRDRFDRWSVYDNSVDGRDPERTESGERVRSERE